MSSRLTPLAGLASVILIASACSSPAGMEPTSTPAQLGLPNPASVFCEEHGGRLEIRTDASGGQQGFCLFADGSECDEWAYFRGECKSGGETVPEPTVMPASTIQTTAAPPEGWEVYAHPTLGYSFLYPTGSSLETDDIGRYIIVVGPLENNEHWPWFGVAHPDLPDYHPPADADLPSWLADHNRLSGRLIGTRAIAGMIAIHTRNENGPQAYDDDRFYLVHAGQVYEITIMHAGKEDWTVYDRFLNSFAF